MNSTNVYETGYCQIGFRPRSHNKSDGNPIPAKNRQVGNYLALKCELCHSVPLFSVPTECLINTLMLLHRISLYVAFVALERRNQPVLLAVVPLKSVPRNNPS